MIRRPPRSTLSSSSAASDVYKRQALEQVRNERGLPVGQGPAQHVLEALGPRDRLTGVARVGVLRELRADLDRRRRDVVRPAPEHELLLAVGLQGLLLVLAPV